MQNCPIGTGEVDFESYFKLVNQLNIGGPISMHFPYNFIENRDKFSHKELLKKTHNFMKNNGIANLKDMLRTI